MNIARSYMPKGKLKRGKSARDIGAAELNRDIAEDFVALIEPRNETEFLRALGDVNSPIYKRLQVLLFEMGLEAEIARVCEEIVAFVALEREKQKEQFLKDLRDEDLKKQKEIQIQNALIQQEEQRKLAKLSELQAPEKIQEAINDLIKQNVGINKQIQHITNQLQNLPQIHNQINQAWQVQQNTQAAAIIQQLAASPHNALKTADGKPIPLYSNNPSDPQVIEFSKAIAVGSPVLLMRAAPHLIADVKTPEEKAVKLDIIDQVLTYAQHIRGLGFAAKQSVEIREEGIETIDWNKIMKGVLKYNNAQLGSMIESTKPAGRKDLLSKAWESNEKYLQDKLDSLKKDAHQNENAIKIYQAKLDKLVEQKRPASRPRGY